jgi:hypothetical protein
MLLQRVAFTSKQNHQPNLQKLGVLFNNSCLSDLIIHIYDEETGEKKLSLASHRLVLYAASEYFRIIFETQKKNSPFAVLDGNLSITLNFSHGLEKEVVELMFRLFYVPVFDSNQMDSDQIKTINHHILYLYQLSLRFTFDALTVYCEELLFANMTLGYFGLLTEFCLVKNEETGRFSIINERISIYSRLMQWYQCCIDHTDYSNLLTTTVMTTSNNNHSDTPTRYNRQYLSCNKEEILRDMMNLVDNIQQCQIPVKNHTISANRESMKIDYYRRICHDCLSNSNKKAKTYQNNYYINFGTLKKYYSNGYEQYSFRLKKRNQQKYLFTENIVEMCIARTFFKKENTPRRRRRSCDDLSMLVEGQPLPEPKDEDYHDGEIANSDSDDVYQNPAIEEEDEEEDEDLDTQETNSGGERSEELVKSRDFIERMHEKEGEPILYSCKTNIFLLSKKVRKDHTLTEYSARDFQIPAEISSFELHQEKHCYEGKCDSCREKKLIYIIQMEIELSKHLSEASDIPICSDTMEMCK